MLRRLFLVFLLSLAAAPVFAVQPDEILADPALEARARALSTQLRCMVCQNESIDDSEAPLARDLRILVREHIERGESDAAVKEFLVARYGDFILLKPPLEWRTLALWCAPFLILAMGGTCIALSLRRRQPRAPAALSEDEQAKVDALLKE